MGWCTSHHNNNRREFPCHHHIPPALIICILRSDHTYSFFKTGVPVESIRFLTPRYTMKPITYNCRAFQGALPRSLTPYWLVSFSKRIVSRSLNQYLENICAWYPVILSSHHTISSFTLTFLLRDIKPSCVPTVTWNAFFELPCMKSPSCLTYLNSRFFDSFPTQADGDGSRAEITPPRIYFGAGAELSDMGTGPTASCKSLMAHVIIAQFQWLA